MKAGTTVVPDLVDATQGVGELEDDGDCVEEAEVIEDAAIFAFPPTWSRREDNREGNESARALEIA